MGMNKALIVILMAATLDAVGAGLIFPILPELLRELTHSGEIAILYGLLLAGYSGMAFLFAPVLGVLSDRIGRRPVLMLAMAGAVVDYLVMAIAPNLAILVVGRLVGISQWGGSYALEMGAGALPVLSWGTPWYSAKSSSTWRTSSGSRRRRLS